MKKFLLFFCFVASLVSCGYKKQAREVTQNFFSAVKDGKEEKMAELYPKVSNLRYYYKSDTISIKEVKELGDKKYSVSLISKFTNRFGKSRETKMIIYTKPKDATKPSEGYVIYDSKGLCDISDEPIYKYGKRKGIIKEGSLTDQQIIKKYDEASKSFIEVAYRFHLYLQDNVIVDNWRWEKSYYGNSASGRGVVKNNTQYAIPDLKYLVTYTKQDGTEVTQDNGRVTYDEIRPYGMESFSFYTTYVGNASRANIKLEFDTDFIFETVAKGEFE